MQRSILTALALALCLCAAAWAGTPYDGLEPLVIRYGNGAALGAAGDVWGEEFCGIVKTITGGKIEVDYFNNSQLGNDSEMQTQLLAGDLDVVSCQTGQTTTFVPEVAVYDLPLVFARYNAAQIDYALTKSEFAVVMNEFYGRKNMICLGVLQGATFRVMTSNKEIKTIDDFAGIKIRTMTSPNHLAFWKTLGANPTPLSFPELYMSLQQGVVDAQENANDTNYSSNFQEVQKYLVNTHHLLYANQFLVNKNWFEHLPKPYQAAIREAVDKATAKVAPTLTDIDILNRDKLVAGGMKNLEFPDAFYNQIIEKSQPVYNEIRGQVGDILVDSLIKALESAK